MLGSTFIRIYFHAYVYLFEYFNSRNINITPASMCSCPCCRILVMIRNMRCLNMEKYAPSKSGTDTYIYEYFRSSMSIAAERSDK